MNPKPNPDPKPCPRSRTREPLAEYFAQMAVDAMNTRNVFQGPGGMWREYEVVNELHRELGPRPRRSCACGVAVRLTRALARRYGSPWPTLEETLERMLAESSPL